MEFSQVLMVIAGWTLLSIPTSLLIGAFIARAEQLPEPRLAEVRSFDQRAAA